MVRSRLYEFKKGSVLRVRTKVKEKVEIRWERVEGPSIELRVTLLSKLTVPLGE